MSLKFSLPLQVSLAALFLLGAFLPANAAVKVNSLFSDHMVVQRGSNTVIWGTADAGEKVAVRLGAYLVEGVAGADGKWLLRFPELKSSLKPETLIVSGTNELRVEDVLVGDVWIGSGQSNMALRVKESSDAGRVQAATEAAQYNNIRLLQISPRAADAPVSEVSDQWQLADLENVGRFSAVLFLAGEALQKEIPDVPIGLINSSVGGTNAYSWTPNAVFKDDPALKYARDWYQKELSSYDEHKVEYDKKMEEFKAKFLALKQQNQPIPASLRPPEEPMGPANVHRPCGLYNAMIAPLEPFAIRGVMWYQGENDSFHWLAKEYYGTIKALVSGWRRDWAKQSGSSGSIDFPFYIVQLPNFSGNPEVDWPQIREVQLRLSNDLPNSGLVVTIDVGNSKAIHPQDKGSVGRRLAQLAAARAYKMTIPYAGPVFKSMSISGNTIKCVFEIGEYPLKSKNGATLNNFSICDESHDFVPAEAVIDGNCVNVSSPKVANPVAVRYAWANDPKSAINFYNSVDLPASPFRTDDFPFDVVK
jgi:sialate O-acetylesterase